MNSKISRNNVSIYSIIALLFEILAVWFLFSRITYFLGSMAGYSVVKIVFIIVLSGVFIFTIFAWNKIEEFCEKIIDIVRKSSYQKLLLTIVFVSLITRIGLLFCLQIDSEHHPDCEMYWSFIKQLTDSGCITEHTEYATSYPYTVMFATFFLPFTKIIGADNIIYMNLYLCILFTFASALLFDTVSFYSGKNVAFASVMAWSIIPIGMLEPLFLAHENSLVFLHSIVIWLFFRVLPDCKKWYYQLPVVVCSALVASFAAKINKLAFIIICALIVVSFIQLVIKNFGFKSVALFLSIMFIFLALMIGVNSISDKYVDSVIKQNECSSTKVDYSIPYGWTLYVGLNYDSHGEWNSEDKETYYKYKNFETREEAEEYQLNLIKDRLNEYISSPKKTLSHLNHKMELLSYGFNPINYDMGNSVNEFIRYGAKGILQKAMTGFFALINIIVAFAMVMTFKFKNNSDSKLEGYLKLFMLGVFAILLFTEVTPKYSSHLLFVYLIITVMGYRTFFGRMSKIRRELLTISAKNQG